jgi:hypothetical protein
MKKAVDSLDETFKILLERAKKASSPEREALILYSGLAPGILRFDDFAIEHEFDMELYLHAFLFACATMVGHALLNAANGDRKLALSASEDFLEAFEDALEDQIEGAELIAKFGRLDF